MRLAILISLVALGLCGTAYAGDDALVPCEVGANGGFLVPVSYAEMHRVDILATLPDEPEVESFWKVSEQIAIVADRNLRERLEDGVKDPTTIFPNLTTGSDTTAADSVEYQRNELKLILEHFGVYHRQFVGLMIDGHEYVLLNYAAGRGLFPATGYLFIHHVFEPGKMRFLQARFNWDYKTISNLSTYGTWQDIPK